MAEKFIQQFVITEVTRGLRLDQALKQIVPQFSRVRLSQWIKDGAVTVNQAVVVPRHKVQLGDNIEINATFAVQQSDQAQAIPLAIVYEDAAILVINKSAGLTVHPGAGNPNGTMLNALLHHCPDLQCLPRAGIVHRLDKDTSGLLVVAKTLAAHNYLVTELQARHIEREYQAIVQAVLTAGGEVDAPIGRHPRQRLKMAVQVQGKPALTHYRVIERFYAHSHVRLHLASGRTHQIRVHMAHIRHPIVGDPLYAGRLVLPAQANVALLNGLRHFKRQALHACRLSLQHPITQQQMEWQAALPEDMQNLLHLLRDDVTQRDERNHRS